MPLPIYSARAILRAQDADRNTALHFVSTNGQLLVLQTLVAAGAEHERRNTWSWTALFKVGVDDPSGAFGWHPQKIVKRHCRFG